MSWQTFIEQEIQGIKNTLSAFETDSKSVNELTEKSTYETGMYIPVYDPTQTGATKLVKFPFASQIQDLSSYVTDAELAAFGYEQQANKGVANGYASLDANGLVPSSQLPAYVDDVLEGTYINSTTFNDLASSPYTGETGKIYVDTTTNKSYRFSGTVFIEIKDDAAVWGSITGSLASQTDLQNALDAKANLTGASFTGQISSTAKIYTDAFFDVNDGTSNAQLTPNVLQFSREGANYIQALGTAGSVIFRTGGANDRGIINSSGNWGIGTTSTNGYKLRVVGTSEFTGVATFGGLLTANAGANITGDQSLDGNILIRRNKAINFTDSGGALRAFIRGTEGTATGDDPVDFNSIVFGTGAGLEAGRINPDQKWLLGYTESQGSQKLQVSGSSLFNSGATNLVASFSSTDIAAQIGISDDTSTVPVLIEVVGDSFRYYVNNNEIYRGTTSLHDFRGVAASFGSVTATAFSGNGAAVTNVDAVALSGLASSDFVRSTGTVAQTVTGVKTFSAKTLFSAQIEQGTSSATNTRSVAFGFGTTSSGLSSVSMHDQTTASGDSSLAGGRFSTASGTGSVAFGIQTLARADEEFAIGRYGTDYTATDTATDRLFNIGNGTSTSSRADAFTVLRSGRAIFTNVVHLGEFTVATLPAGNDGDTAYVTDSNDSISFHGVVTTGGGAKKSPVWSDGTDWYYG